MAIAKPTKEILEWQELEFGVIIHYCLEMYKPRLRGSWYKTSRVRKELDPKTIRPTKLEPEEWVRIAAEAGAKYAVLVANHATGFSLWDTKVNDFSIAHTDWRGGGGDVCREFIEACKKYGVKPGFYYTIITNGYYDIDNGKKQDYRSEKYQSYLKCAEAQLKELWTEYGELAEIWFDGGVIPVDEGGIDIASMLKKYQPNAVCFQGPAGHPHNVRWVGNEEGIAPVDCWATTNSDEGRFDGTEPDGTVGVGDPDGKYYWPAECDMPNRKHSAFGGGWAWKKGEEKLIYSPEELLDRYIRSVGRNGNLLLGMAINTDGGFSDEEQFIRFGELLKEHFGKAKASLDSPALENGRASLSLGEGDELRYLVIREDISDGQHVRGFRVLADGKSVFEARSIGHKRIVPLGGIKAKEIAVEITSSEGASRLRDIVVF